MKRKVPTFKTDAEAEAFLDQDLSDLDFSQFKPTNFTFTKKNERVTMNFPVGLLHAVKASAASKHIRYQQYIHQVLEQSLR